MTRKLLWGVAAAAAIVFVVFAVRGFPPVGGGTEVRSADVVAALQNPALRVTLNNVDLMAALRPYGPTNCGRGCSQLQEALSAPGFVAALTDPRFAEAMAAGSR